MKKEVVIEIILAVVIIALVWSIYFGFFYYAKCSDDKCFADALVKCNKVTYSKNTPDILMSYKILGEKNNACEINVRLVQVKSGSASLTRFENKEMVCSIPVGSLTMPESNLQNCDGPLRQEIQEAMINNMHSQLVENINFLNVITTAKSTNQTV